VWEGGSPITVWPLGLAYLAVAGAVLLVLVPRPPLAGAPKIALAAALALLAWSALSLAWADDRGLGWVATARLGLAVTALALPLLWPPTRHGLRLALAALAGCGVLGLVTALVAAHGDAAALIDGRLTAPAGYANASAALLFMGALASVGLAADAGVRTGARALALGAAVLLSGGALLTQSRGSLAAVLGGVIVLLALAPRRGVVAAAIAVVALTVAAAAGTLLGVREAWLDGDAVPALERAVLTLTAAALAAALAGVLVLRSGRLRDALHPPPAWVAWRPPRSARVALAAGAAILVAGVLLAGGAGWVGDRARDLADPDYETLEASDTRFTGDLGSNRVDYWRASLGVLGDRPVTGAGAAGFTAEYVRRRETDKTPLYAHSIWMQAGADLGGVGLILLLTATGALGVGVVRRRRAVPEPERMALAAAAAPLGYALVHASADWVSHVPVVAVPALGLAAAACGAGTGAPAGPVVRARTLIAAVAVVGATVLLAGPPYAAGRLQELAARDVARDPGRAFDRLRRARDLEPLGRAPAVQEGVYAVDLGEVRRAEEAFAIALDRDPNAWFAQLALGLLDARAGRRDAALARLGRAARLTPREPEIERAIELTRRGRAPAPDAVLRAILSRTG
jgi:hypothetical protein